MTAIRSALAAVLGTDPVEITPIAGGDVARAYRVTDADGRIVFAKTQDAGPAGAFTTEAIGLRWLRAADAVPVPEVLAVSDQPTPILVLEWIEPGERPADGNFGAELARLHAAGAPAFGRTDGRTTGSRGLPNDPVSSWPEFFATRRLLPLRRLAVDALPSAALAMIDDIVERIDTLAGPPEPPARLHGDLWAGNRLVDHRGRSWLVDPACFGGHREFDLAMMRLFGGFSNAEFERYQQIAPLSSGWEQRVELWQLAPLIVHAIKFGGGYRPAVERAARSVLASA